MIKFKYNAIWSSLSMFYSILQCSWRCCCSRRTRCLQSLRFKEKLIKLNGIIVSDDSASLLSLGCLLCIGIRDPSIRFSVDTLNVVLQCSLPCADPDCYVIFLGALGFIHLINLCYLATIPQIWSDFKQLNPVLDLTEFGLKGWDLEEQVRKRVQAKEVCVW